MHFLRNLRSRHRYETPGGRLMVFHGSPEDPENKIDLNDAHPAEILKMLESIRSRYAVVAGKHIPFRRVVLKGVVYDPGSVGLSLGGEPGADVLILEDDIHGEIHHRFLKLPYDYGQVTFDLAPGSCRRCWPRWCGRGDSPSKAVWAAHLQLTTHIVHQQHTNPASCDEQEPFPTPHWMSHAGDLTPTIRACAASAGLT